jgi:hypothetical protein
MWSISCTMLTGSTVLGMSLHLAGGYQIYFCYKRQTMCNASNADLGAVYKPTE